MINLNGTAGNTFIDDSKIQYWYQLGSSLNFILNNNLTKSVSFQNPIEAAKAGFIVKEKTYKYCASIPGVNGYVYNILCDKIKSHSVATATITIVFNSFSLAIVCINSTNAAQNNDYLANIFYSAHLSKNWASKTVRTVSNSIQEIIDISSAGDAIFVPKGNYYEELIIKNSVEFYFEQGAKLFSNNSGTPGLRIMRNIITGFSFKVFGYGQFYWLEYGQINPPDAAIAFNTLNNIYFEFDYIFCYKQPFFINTNAGTSTYLKGKRIDSLNPVYQTSRGIDTDGYFVLDLDVVYLKTYEDIIYGQPLVNSTFNLRTAYVELFSSTSAISLGDTFVLIETNIIGSMIIHKARSLTITDDGTLYNGGTDVNYLNLFSSYFESNKNEYSIRTAANASGGSIILSLLGNSYSNKNYDPSVTVVNASNYNYDSNLTLS